MNALQESIVVPNIARIQSLATGVDVQWARSCTRMEKTVKVCDILISIILPGFLL